MANLLSTTVNGALSASGRISVTYNTDRFQFNFNRTSASDWWVTNDSTALGLHVNNVGDKFYFSTAGDFYSDTNGWLSTALADKQNASTAITTSNIGSQSVNYASSSNTANYLPTLYAGGVQANPQTYFGQSVGLRVAMTGVPFAWCDTLWINGYSGGDVLSMCAIHTARNGQPRMWISSQNSNGSSYGTTYEVISAWNIASQSVSYAASAGVVGTADYAVTAGDADTVDGYNYSQFTGVLARYITTAGSSARIRITAPFNTNSSKMFSVDINMYAGYTQYKYTVSGYMYGSINQWYEPKAVFTGTGTPDIYVGRDNSGRAYISIANGNYTGIVVNNFVSGYVASTADAYNPWSITLDSGNENSVGVGVVTTITSANIGSQSVNYATSSGNSATVDGRGVGNSRNNVAYFSDTGNLFVNNPEEYSGEVRLGAAWNRGGVYASGVLSLSTSSSETHFVFSNGVPIYVNSSGSIIGNGTINFTGKSHYLGVGNGWDNIGFGSLTNLHFQGHPQFWVGAGNAYWWSGGIVTEHDLLISTMSGYDSTSYYRGITFAVDVNGNGGTGGYRLGRWQTHNTDWKTSRLQVDASLSVGYGNRTNRAFDEAKYPLDRGVWGHGRDDSGYGDNRIRDLLFSPTTNGGGPWGSFASLEVSSVYDGNSDVPALFRMHQWGSGAAEFWKPRGTTLYLRESPSGGSTWFTRFEVQGQLTVTGTSELNSLQLGSAPSDTSNLKLDVQGNMAIRGSNGLYFGVSTNNYNSWSTRIYASGSTQYFNAQQFIFDNQGYGSTTFATINSSGLFVTNNYVSNYFQVESGRAVNEFGHVAMFRSRQSAATNYIPFSFQSQYGNHSWGQIARFHIEGTDGSDRPSIQFSSGYNNTRWNVGYCYYDDNFRIVQNMGFRPDMSGNTDNWGTERFRINTDGSMYCFSSFTASGDVTAYSDLRVKDNIETIPNAIDKVKSIRGVTFTRTDNDDNKKYMGVIAQELLNVIPEVVSETDSGMYTVAYGNITAVLIEAIKEQQKQIDELKAKLDGLTK